jgi:hypothetical protein
MPPVTRVRAERVSRVQASTLREIYMLCNRVCTYLLGRWTSKVVNIQTESRFPRLEAGTA